MDKRTMTDNTFNNFSKNNHLQNKDKKNNQENINLSYLSSSYFSDFNVLENKPMIQSKLEVSQARYVHETEADRVAEHIVNMPDITLNSGNNEIDQFNQN
jgi:hypothetical protein